MARARTGAAIAGTVFVLFGAAQAGTAHADATTVWEHGGSNMGECSAYLAQLDVPGSGNVRADVNHVIQEYGGFLGISSPGALYSVRAKQAVNRLFTFEGVVRLGAS